MRLRLMMSVATVTMLLAACSVREARIALPANLTASTERLELTGMGGGTRGDFNLAGAYGTFTRSAERIGIFDPLLVRHQGGGAFQIEPGSGNAGLAGRCSYREGQVNVGPVAITPDRLVYYCEFARDGAPIDAELIIEDPKNAFGTVHGRSERQGTIFYEGQQIEIRSIHRDEGGGLPSPTALGYLLVDESGEIGAIDMNGLNKTIFAPLLGEKREAVLAAALALSIFWDPAEVQPDE
ncbi:hypothetical protein G7A66_04885 [Altererythrobacter sp. SALINAS58]|uniref:hypothetical protein n=1 Tax=Alteripontixanthobacter muriae TaxID=2705546 RepID=UPI0019D67682|nr:hypothetical protein [Alteripontixanthobacter muriae]NTZ42432.1 hypothetical protein [Alteripontixanthobacter muriae]